MKRPCTAVYLELQGVHVHNIVTFLHDSNRISDTRRPPDNRVFLRECTHLTSSTRFNRSFNVEIVSRLASYNSHSRVR